MKRIYLDHVDASGSKYYTLLAWLGLIVAVGLGCMYYMEHNGHWVTGMNNEVVWGTPHVFAVFLIVAASGALNVASVSSVFSRKMYKPLAPLSTVLSVSLLAGGLAVLVLDLGRPDRLTVAMTSYNFKSIFSWNIYLYTGFFVIVLAYLWTMMERRMHAVAPRMGLFAFVWRLALTTGTGSIFGFIVARQAFDAAIMAPMFIVFSFAYGLAFFNLVVMAIYSWTDREMGLFVTHRMSGMLRIFVAGSFYFVIVYHLTNLYATEHHGWETFVLMNGGIYTTLFWVGQVGIGYVLPMILLFHSGTRENRGAIAGASILVILGGMAQMYVTIIGGQAFPLVLFPGLEVSSSFADGVVASYTPSGWEVGLGVMGFAITLLIVTVAIKALRIVPNSLADKFLDPDYEKTQAQLAKEEALAEQA
ncbi:NrfD/PsrC family molybdoenzyme membrane anchor subunit [Magnetospira sp. QH-2]|uniref:NrfD/PsrC family molybdoenzyme membrane anchor subunit n=1 Tax=Magnetospira sp. (strain QH-2) TaxID=1288970 RepID=UPI0003E80DE0|nr:NrfD/PsrC family molybdoenzyme membrane anchor subunit [Magnetospira sp. QH-2]CCQ74013.1 Integral membrane subunit DsrP, involved in the intracellular sulfur oxidation [Magnetospira sp. QH-2]